MAPSTISDAFKGRLAAARLPSGLGDAAHPDVVAWANERGIPPQWLLEPVPAAGRDAPPRKQAHSKQRPPKEQKDPPKRAHIAPRFEGPNNIEDLLGWTLRELIDQFGSAAGLGEWLDDCKKIADIRRLQLNNAEASGALISRELVRTHVFGYLTQVNHELLRDAAVTINTRQRNLIAVLATKEQTLEETREILSRYLKNTKNRITRSLRSGNPDEKEEPPADPEDS